MATDNCGINEVVSALRKNNRQNAFITVGGERKSIISMSMIMERMRKLRIKKGENVKISSFMDEKYRPITEGQNVGLVMRILEANHCVVVRDEASGKWTRIIEEDDFLGYITS